MNIPEDAEAFYLARLRRLRNAMAEARAAGDLEGLETAVRGLAAVLRACRWLGLGSEVAAVFAERPDGAGHPRTAAGVAS